MPRCTVKMLVDYSENVDKEGHDRTIYPKGAVLTVNKKQADKWVKKKLAKIVPNKPRLKPKP